MTGCIWAPADSTPRKFLADVREQIAEVALSSPKSLIGMNRWSLPKLREYGSSEKICNTTTEIQTSKEARIAGHFREFGFG